MVTETSTVWSRFQDSVQRFPTNLAVADDRLSLDYQELYALSLAVAGHLRQLGAEGNVGILLPNGVGFFASFFGITGVPATAVPLNLLLRPQELADIIEHAQLDTVLTARALADRLPGNLKHVVCLDELLPRLLERAGSASPSEHQPVAEDLAAIIYTSGTTGTPKGVMLSHRNLVSNVMGCERVLELDERYVVLGVLPTFHCFALTVTVLLPMFVGAKAIQLSRFAPAAVLRTLEEYGVSVMPAVPSIFGSLARSPEASDYDLSALEICISGAEPLPHEVYEAFHRAFGRRLVQGYGLTECSPVVAVNPPFDPRPETVGPPLPGLEVEVRGPEGKLPAGEVGEVVVRGDSVMVGYFRDPEGTRAVLDEDGWFRTGDLGYFDDRAHLVLCGRKKELIIVGGENVFPGEVEAALRVHPEVAVAAVVGVADAVRGEVPRAYVVLEKGASVTPAGLRRFALQSLAPYKVPREIIVEDELPMSPTGKVLKRELARE